MVSGWVVSGLLAALGVLGTPPPKPTGKPINATMDCRVDAGTGRLVCTVELAPSAGYELTWSDALVVEAPPRAQPLLSRIAGRGRPPRRIEIGFVLGSGEGGRIKVLARAVTCRVKRPSDCGSSVKRVEFNVPGS